MKKFELLILGVSLVATLLVSSLFGLVGPFIIGTFFGWFWVAFLLQIICFVAYNSFLIQKDGAALELAQIQAFETFSKFTIQLTCAYCRQPNIVPIQLNQRNTFKCESCNQANAVTMQFSATALTTPVESVKIPLEGSDSIEFKVSA